MYTIKVLSSLLSWEEHWTLGGGGGWGLIQKFFGDKPSSSLESWGTVWFRNFEREATNRGRSPIRMRKTPENWGRSPNRGRSLIKNGGWVWGRGSVSPSQELKQILKVWNHSFWYIIVIQYYTLYIFEPNILNKMIACQIRDNVQLPTFLKKSILRILMSRNWIILLKFKTWWGVRWTK